jgi:hypothetical protein
MQPNVLETCVNKLKNKKEALSPARKIKISIRINKTNMPHTSKKCLFFLTKNIANNNGNNLTK